MQVLDIGTLSSLQIFPGGSFSLYQLHKELISSPNLHTSGLGWEQYSQYALSTSSSFPLFALSK